MDFITRSEADGDLITARLVFIELAKGPGGLAPFADEDKEKTTEAQNIRIVLNEYELISIGVQRGILDLELYRRWKKIASKLGSVLIWFPAATLVEEHAGSPENIL